MVITVSAIVAALAVVLARRARGKDGASHTPHTTADDATSGAGGRCDISAIEAICQRDETARLDMNEIPHCVQDIFDTVIVGVVDDGYYQKNSQESLRSCSPTGLALKRIAASVYERGTSDGLWDCEYAFYTLYYSYGQVEWWTAEGAIITDVCERRSVHCNSEGQVETFETDLGATCTLSDVLL